MCNDYARVKLNGKELEAHAWQPYRWDVTNVVKAGIERARSGSAHDRRRPRGWWRSASCPRAGSPRSRWRARRQGARRRGSRGRAPRRRKGPRRRAAAGYGPARPGSPGGALTRNRRHAEYETCSNDCLFAVFLAVLFTPLQFGLERPDVTFKIFQFPPDKIPRIDGNTDDWAIVPDSYSIGMDQLMDTEARPRHESRSQEPRRQGQGGLGQGPQPPLFPLRGLRQLLGLLATWTCTTTSSKWWWMATSPAGPLIDIYHRDIWTPEAVGKSRSVIDPRISQRDAHWAMHGVHAQNYHIFTRPATRTGRWRGAARSTSSGCPTPTPPTTTISSPARAAS